MTDASTEIAWVVCTGDELIEGRLIDGNGAWLAKWLSDDGFKVERVLLIGDDQATLVSVLQEARLRTRLVVISGGLGATLDDMTREALASAFSRPLQPSPEAHRMVAEFWARRSRSPSEEPWPESMVPEGARLIANTHGLAPGLAIDEVGFTAIALPGVPVELEDMVRSGALRLTRRGGAFVARADIGIAGFSESALAAKLGSMLTRGRRPLVGICAKDGCLALHVRCKAVTLEAAESAVADDVQRIRDVAGAGVFTTSGESLAQAVARILLERSLRVSIAESLTGGLVGSLLTEVPGVSAALHAVYVCYADESKRDVLGVRQETMRRFGAVSRECAEEMARGAVARGGVDFAVATTGIAGPTGGSPEKPVGTTWLAVADSRGLVVAESHAFGTHRLQVKRRAAQGALDLLRRVVSGHVTPA